MNQLPERLRRWVMEREHDPTGDLQRALFAEDLCRQLEGHLLQLIAENDRLAAKLRQSRKTVTLLRRGLRKGKS